MSKYSEQIDRMADEMGVRVERIPNWNKGNSGYSPSMNYIALAADDDVTNYIHGLHELGHADDARHGGISAGATFMLSPDEVLEAEVRAWEFALSHAATELKDRVRLEAAFALGTYWKGQRLPWDGYDKFLDRLDRAAA